jgi:heme-degrading monooxygenase HmoA
MRVSACQPRRYLMHARISTYKTDDPDRLVEGFKRISPDLEQVDGFSHAYFLIDKDSGNAVSITIWESEDALLASKNKADELRKRGTEPSGTAIESVDHYEISHQVGSPMMSRA